MLRKTVVSMALVAVSATTASAQATGEVSFSAGYTLSEGFTVDPVVIGGQAYNKVDPKSGASINFTGGVLFGGHAGVEFRWSRQFSQLLATSSSTELAVADMHVDNYHGNFVYHWGETDARVRPFFFGGLGATHYAPGTLNALAVPLPSATAGNQIQSTTKFSTIWGGGVKIYGHGPVGAKIAATWTPTYIKSDPAGIWCSPYYCWVLASADYSNQFEMSGGVTVRFGNK
jgi:hypothetical protein